MNNTFNCGNKQFPLLDMRMTGLAPYGHMGDVSGESVVTFGITVRSTLGPPFFATTIAVEFGELSFQARDAVQMEPWAEPELGIYKTEIQVLRRCFTHLVRPWGRPEPTADDRWIETLTQFTRSREELDLAARRLDAEAATAQENYDAIVRDLATRKADLSEKRSFVKARKDTHFTTGSDTLQSVWAAQADW